MTALGRTAYDDLAPGPGPTIDAVLAGTLGGVAAAFGAAGGPGSAWALAVPLAPLLAGAWAGRTHPARWAAQGALAGLLVGVWASAASVLGVGMEAAIVRLAVGLETATMSAEALLDHATSGGLLAATTQTLVLVAGSAALAAVGAFVGSYVRPVAPRPLDPWLLDHVRRLALCVAALAALLPGDLTVLTGPDGLSAALLADLAFQSVAAGLAFFVVRAAWRLPRTAPETPARVAVDGLFVVVLLLAVMGGRYRVGGPWVSWVAPWAPWGLAVLALAWSGRPKPPPRPPRGAVSLLDAAAFAGLVVGGVLALASVRLAPVLVRPLAVDPWTAVLSDPTAEPPPLAMLMTESTRLVHTGAQAIAVLGLLLALATWVSRRVTASWIGHAERTE